MVRKSEFARPITGLKSHLIEETKPFGPKGFRKRLLLKQPKGAFANSRSGRSGKSARRQEYQGYCAVGVMPRTPNRYARATSALNSTSEMTWERLRMDPEVPVGSPTIAQL